MSPGDLDQLLCGLELPTDPNLLVGAGTCDDAGVYKLDEKTALIQTLDFFTPIVDDPFSFGQIAAANSLSDVYAMGGRPLLAMNIVCFPIKNMDKAILRKTIEGGLAKIRESGAMLVGGHSIEDDEMKYGLSVTGVVHPEQVLLNSGARPGHKILLTKPLGTGILSTAIKGNLADTQTAEEIDRIMAELNKIPSESMVRILEKHGDFNIACTDITGFGLLGHLYETALASGVSIRITASALPVLPGAVHFADMGIIPEGAHNNREFYKKWVDSKLDALNPLEIIAYDPQTSGGLLICAPPVIIDEIQEEIESSGYLFACSVIGEITEQQEAKITVL